jgi:hypothetical protein
MLVCGAAGRKLKDLIAGRIANDRISVKALRFANKDILDDPLSVLPTVNFMHCSGLESPMPIIVDCLISNYIEKICPRNIFSKILGEHKKDLSPTEMSMFQTALCTVYTVVTRCRGPLIWLETFNAEDHPLVKKLKVVMEQYKIKISFTADKDSSLIDEKFVKDIFSPIGSDMDDFNFEWGETIRSQLFNVRRDFRACLDEYKQQQNSSSSSELLGLAALKDTSEFLCKTLNLCDFPAAADLREAIAALPSLFTIHTGVWVSDNCLYMLSTLTY